MTVELFIFYIFSIVTVASSVMVISSKNPVHSVLFLILAFFNAAGLFILIGVEFLAMVLVVVYVGAVAVLFMFVVMMLDINFVELREGFLQYLPIGALIGVILLVELILVGTSWAVSSGTDLAVQAAGINATPTGIPNTKALGMLIYTNYFYLFQSAGLILLVSIIGAITLTLRERVGVRRQNISRQVNRKPSETVQLVKVKSGEGI
ncbi:NADH dehydrogenase subunit J [Arboricoccus pini]|uniref:NADH-quinone oxidoreductase subunit J n=1 Tax=Arboricoccus pini TaxID=1963835 RepID=A0A212PWI0_9PROT|nr:NADH-quinone oxidoreductase subunit J [Arboricoccus pini]SNB51255.1 NADH dehydrogenase subunit J [Arboricoccus pini]